MRGEEGAAAVEMAFVAVLLLTIFGFLAPLGVVYYRSTQLGRDVADVVRFATSRPPQDRTVVDQAGTLLVLPGGRVPSSTSTADRALVVAEVFRVSGGGSTLTDYSSTPDADCPGGATRGTRVSITVTKRVDLSVFAGLTGLITSTKDKDLSATASSCKE